MNKFRKCVANCVYSFNENLVFLLLEYLKESFLGGLNAQYALVPVKTQSPQKPAAIYRSIPYPL